jgi:hypothetical protein
MAVSKLNPITDDNWVLVSTNSPSAATTSTFSSLSGYKSYMLIWKMSTFSGNGTGLIRFNGDSTEGNYGGGGQYGTATGASNSGLILGPYFGLSWAPMGGHMIVDNANKAVPKNIKIIGGMTTIAGSQSWYGVDAITSIELSISGGETFTGTVSLYGLPA